MNFSIICTAIPSLGRLIVELQPEVNAFAITEQHGIRNNDQYDFSPSGHRRPLDYVRNNSLGVHTSVLGSQASRAARKKSDAESERWLREDGIRQNSNAIRQMVGFEFKYMDNEGSPA
jgi:hypothetical protein